MKKIILYILVIFTMNVVYAQNQFNEVIFNLKAIMNDPLDAKILSTTKKENIVFQEVEFTSEIYQNSPVRIYGIVAFPEGAHKLPAIFWSQAGMSPANKAMPELFAKMGYVCMCITLPHKIWNPHIASNTKNPEDGNMTHYAISQMRAITYLCSMLEVDPEKIGIGGSSYGGFFSTLIAGADPRIKCGMSFFAGGNMMLGTHIPQFTQLTSLEDVNIWNNTIDPAIRLRYRSVPFLWGVAANDNWFYLPSVVKTYCDSIGEKRIAIIPLWEHGFPEEIDQQLFSWFDIYLKQTKKPYNSVSPLVIKKINNKLYATWSFSGDNKIKKAEIIVSYGKILPWKWWIYRNYVSFPAEIKDNNIKGEIPVVEPDIEMYVFGNITDENGAIASTMPVEIKASDYGIKKANSAGEFNLFQWKIFDRDTEKNFIRMGISQFVFDSEVKMGKLPSIRIEPGKTQKKNTITFKLNHVPMHSHVLKVWAKAESKTEITLNVQGVEFPDSKSTVVNLLRNQNSYGKIPVFTTTKEINEKWQYIELQCPYNNDDVEGYVLNISSSQPVTYWLSQIVFQPVWKKNGSVK